LSKRRKSDEKKEQRKKKSFHKQIVYRIWGYEKAGIVEAMALSNKNRSIYGNQTAILIRHKAIGI
jgi:hypothetical protein